MQKRSFGRTKEGREVTEYTLVNAQGMTLSVIDLGATIVSITMKGSDGNVYDVVLGYDTPVDYQNNTCYFGAVIGRNANRIDHAHIHLDGKDYSLEANDNENNLHSGSHGFHAVIWDVVQESAQSITFSYVSRDGEQDFPGNMTAKVTYTLDDNGEVAIAYEAVCDQTTVANFTNHAYFNLDGHDSGVMEGQKLELHASYYTPVIDSKAIPTGELAKVAGTPFDFRAPKRVGQDIGADDIQLKNCGGYDHNFCLTRETAAILRGETSGITMTVRTTLPGMQLYTANFLTGRRGKNGAAYAPRCALCLETQYFPNAMACESFEKPILRAGERWEHRTAWTFS